MSITITPRELGLIKSVLSFPTIDEILLSDPDILEVAVYPALLDYFRKFPLKQEVQLNMGGTSEIVVPFPDEQTYGALRMAVTDVGIVTGTGTSFWDLVYFQQLSGGSLLGGGSGAYGQQGYNPSNLIQTRDMQRAAYKSYQNTYSTLNYTVDEENRQVKAYSTVVGYLNITWAKWSEDFGKVKYARKMEVIKLAQSYLLNHFADTFSMLTDTALDMSINTEAIKARATELKTEITELWASYPDIFFLHSA